MEQAIDVKFLVLFSAFSCFGAIMFIVLGSIAIHNTHSMFKDFKDEYKNKHNFSQKIKIYRALCFLVDGIMLSIMIFFVVKSYNIYNKVQSILESSGM